MLFTFFGCYFKWGIFPIVSSNWISFVYMKVPDFCMLTFCLVNLPHSVFVSNKFLADYFVFRVYNLIKSKQKLF